MARNIIVWKNWWGNLGINGPIVILFSRIATDGHFSSSDLTELFTWNSPSFPMAGTPPPHHYQKSDAQRPLLPLTDRDSGHYQPPSHCLNGWLRLLSAGVAGFWLEEEERGKGSSGAERKTALHFQQFCSQGRNGCTRSYVRHAVSLIFSCALGNLLAFAGEIDWKWTV